MNGKLTVRAIKLDYTNIAAPLTFKQIREDLDELHAKFDEEPEELVLWEHQVDWLVKRERGGAPLEQRNVFGFAVGLDFGLAEDTTAYIFGSPEWKTGAPVQTIFGVPIRVQVPA